MGTSIACKFATLYLAGHEINYIIPKYKQQFICFRQYIDDIFVIWNPIGEHTWQELHKDLFFGKLKWKTEKPSKQTNFLDLTIRFDKTDKIFTKTYEKTNNLHLYVPANSAHPTGKLKSLLTGMIRRYWLQNTNINDFIKQIKMFTKRLLKRGYNSDKITKNFILASENLQLKMGNQRKFIKKPQTHKSLQQNILSPCLPPKRHH